jgi:hypothetical protein
MAVRSQAGAWERETEIKEWVPCARGGVGASSGVSDLARQAGSTQRAGETPARDATAITNSLLTRSDRAR